MPGMTFMVDFYLYASHEVAVWEPMWQALRRRGVDAAFILEPPGVHTASGSVPDGANGWRDDKAGPVVPLMNEATFTAIGALLDGRGLPHLDARRVDADAVITTQGTGWLWPYQGLKIKTEYGASAFHGAFGHGWVNTGLDAVLVHGPFSAAAIGAHLDRSRIVEVGYPKWAPARRAGIGRDAARVALGLPLDRPVAAWLPTWAHNSGIEAYAAALGALADRYLVVAKPHHNNVRFESERLAAIDPRVDVRRDLHSLVELVLAADVVIADARSGVLAEVLLADRPAVGLLPAGETPRSVGVLPGFDETVVWCDRPDDLVAAVARARTCDLGEARAPWRRWFFGDSGVDDDERAADVIVRLVRDRRAATVARVDGPTVDRALDRLAGQATPDPRVIVATFESAWACWPGHPRLLRLVADHRDRLDIGELLACSRAIRRAGHEAECPLVASVHDPGVDPVRRLAATAVLGLELEDADAAAAFPELAVSLDPDRYVDALVTLDRVPGSLPAFVMAAATDSGRCEALAAALDRLGATSEAELVAAHGRTLAEGVAVPA